MASSSSSPTTFMKYDVFISFRGSDVREGFLSHFLKALVEEKVETFVDEQLERGEEISKSLLERIAESYIAVVIFSQNYAYSEWCLEELVKIVECKKLIGQIVLPVFYSIDPTHVQDLTGSYGDAIAQHKKKFDESLVQSWGHVLMEVAALSGLVSSNFKSDSKLIEEIIKQIFEKLNCLFPSDSSCDDGLIGINSHVKNVMSLLCGTEDVRVVGIWGAGGIGKTTLARATFDRICSQFDSQCFVENVREKLEKCTADAILNEVLSSLFGTSNSDMTRKRVSRKKVILVLDDVSDLYQIKSVMRYNADCGFGSRLIVTSRDRHLLKNLGAEIYTVEKLNDDEALQLFCLHAFKENIPQQGYLELSKRAVAYAQGLPLAVVVLGSNLYGRSVEEWEDELEELKGQSDKKIQEILRVSYDRLSNVQKEILLDIACFFKGRCRDEVERTLDVAGSKIGINRLAEKALISISSENWINMHDLIQQMAKDIICEEKAPKKRRLLWNPEEIYNLLTREMGTEAIKGISLDMSKIKNINLSPTAFQRLYNLRYLNFYASRINSQVCVPRGLKYFPEQLRCLCWVQYPSKSLPLTSICAEKLVELDMRESQLEELWNGVQNLPNLKRINLSDSKKLIKIPDLSRASNLESLILSLCTSLVEIPSSLKYLSTLAELRLYLCSRLESLPDEICNLKSLIRLNVSYCENLHGLPQDLGDLESLEHLNADSSGLKELPETICNLKNLRRLDVSGCVNLHRLPQNFGNLKSLEKLWAGGSGIKELPDSICNLKTCEMLDVGDCVDLHGLPQNIGDLESLQKLYAYRSGIKEVPSSINNLRKLTILSFSGCRGLILPLTGDFPHLAEIYLSNCGISEFPIGLCSVTSLEVLFLDGNNFESIPESIQHLLKLRVLVLCDCKKLKYLPGNMKLLSMLSELDLRGCTSLEQNECSKITDIRFGPIVEHPREFTRICYPGSEVPQKMMHQNKWGSSLSFSLKLLEHVGKYL